jgi:hypothetical protein
MSAKQRQAKTGGKLCPLVPKYEWHLSSGVYLIGDKQMPITELLTIIVVVAALAYAAGLHTRW